MTRKILASLALALLLLASSLPAVAAKHDSGHGGGHGSSHGSEHGAEHGTADDMIPLGEATVDSVTATAHLNDVHEAMAKAGQSFTHHLQISFAGSKGEKLTEGAAAVKVTPPGGEEGAAVPLTGMDGHFGADLTLSGSGTYRFTVGTKLADGEKRQFVFQHDLP